jgi:hypothetical protein
LPEGWQSHQWFVDCHPEQQLYFWGFLLPHYHSRHHLSTNPPFIHLSRHLRTIFRKGNRNGVQKG